jgi:hypothetical protein
VLPGGQQCFAFLELECNINSNAMGYYELGFIIDLVKYNIVDY